MPLRNGVGIYIAHLSGGLYTAGGSFGSPAWALRLEAVEIAGFGIRQQYRASVVRNSRASVTCDLSIEQWGRDSDPFPRFRIDLNRDPIAVLAPRLSLWKKLDGLPFCHDGFNQVFIKLAFGQQFHIQLWGRRLSINGHSKKRPNEIGSINRLFQIHIEVKH